MRTTIKLFAKHAQPYLLDTNILLRWANPSDSQHAEVKSALTALQTAGEPLFIAPQNVAEFWNTATRPLYKNGFGWTPAQAGAEVTRLEGLFTVLEESRAAYDEWRRLVVDANVSGVQVHDARLAALMRVSSIDRLLTLNVRDFVRFGVTPITPQEINAGIIPSPPEQNL